MSEEEKKIYNEDELMRKVGKRYGVELMEDWRPAALKLYDELTEARRKLVESQLAFVLSDSILPPEFEPELPPTKRLHTYIERLQLRVNELEAKHAAK